MAIQRIPVLIDSQEQTPWQFDSALFAVSTVKLPTGDYSFPGYEHTFCIERKSLGDLVGTVIHDRIRFRKQLKRMSMMDLALIAIEADECDVRERRYESEANPDSVLGALDAYLMDHGVNYAFIGPRPQCFARAANLLLLAWKKLTGVR